MDIRLLKSIDLKIIFTTIVLLACRFIVENTLCMQNYEAIEYL